MNKHLVLLLFLAFFISKDTLNVNGFEYYLGESGYDSNNCQTSLTSCKTLGAVPIKDNVDNAETYIVYIMDITSISQQLSITQTASARTFTKGPTTSETYCEIKVYDTGYFFVQGSVHFSYIEFIVDSGTSYETVINVPSSSFYSTAVVTLEVCKMSMTTGASSISRRLILQQNGSLNIDNLNAENITTQYAIIYCNSSVRTVSITNSHFENVIRQTDSDNSQGGIIYVSLSTSGHQLTLSGTQFIQCKSTSTYAVGGALYLLLDKYATGTLSNLEFKQCEAYRGGAIYIQLSYSSTGTLSDLVFNQCQASNGGGILAFVFENAQLTLSSSGSDKQCLFSECKANGVGGGGMYVSCLDGGIVNLNQQCKFYKCISDWGNGGAIDLYMNFTQIGKFIINDAIIQECEAKQGSFLTSRLGYGGGIFIGVTGNYGPSVGDVIDLHGMKIDGNKADKLGQTLYVVMNELERWCKEGTAGYYVKGNYSDATSDENQLMGIAKRKEIYDYYSVSQIQSETIRLESYWNDGSGSDPGDDDDFSGNEFYIQTSGSSDSNECTQSNPCSTLYASAIRSNISNSIPVLVYIIGQTSINNQLTITQASQPSTFRNQGQQSTILSYIYVGQNGQFSIQGYVKFNYIEFVVTDVGNQGLSVITEDKATAIITITNCIVTSDITASSFNRIFIKQDLGKLSLNNITVIDFISEKGIIINDEATELLIANSRIENITRSDVGQYNEAGAVQIRITGSTGKLNVIGTRFIGCKSSGSNSLGGGIYLYLENKAVASFDGVSFRECEARNGGGLYSSIGDGQIMINDCNFYQCSAQNGGAIYANINFQTSTQFTIKETLFSECTATSSQSSDYTGRGGAIFLAGTGDYSASSNGLNLKGMKIYNNTADKSGQSLYVVMTKLSEWCQYGTAGEYVKGNYSESNSDVNELVGIADYFNQFEKLPIDQIEDKQQYLECYWSDEKDICPTIIICILV
ncbi:MAG: hypothetical protein EZS28_029240 [Streblomastix strix]|uniref:Right handed beta helix domain-containing protein n=1 Tax=Streblomastix strix TaxID=222440 RepID=A0A5J4UYH8_9EUKA|nr:MAG: hypothetical protein EZS28_029240 [Streblomastix strix]